MSIDLKHKTVGMCGKWFCIEPLIWQNIIWRTNGGWSCQTLLLEQGNVFNSLAPAGCGSNFRIIIFQPIIQNINWVNPCEISLRCMPQNLTDKSTLVRVMAWCRQATSHYLNQCWPRYMSPYGVTRPQWVNGLGILKNIKQGLLIGNLSGYFWYYFTL